VEIITFQKNNNGENMPNRDGTGPRWSNGNWNCMGRRGGRMPRCLVGRNLTKEEEKEILSVRLEFLKTEIDNINKKLNELSA